MRAARGCPRPFAERDAQSESIISCDVTAVAYGMHGLGADAMTEQGTGESIQGNGTTMKRRGILRAAGMALGTVVASIAAKQTSQPVRANSYDDQFIANGSDFSAFSTSGQYSYGVFTLG